jgi:hypothetical protein
MHVRSSHKPESRPSKASTPNVAQLLSLTPDTTLRTCENRFPTSSNVAEGMYGQPHVSFVTNLCEVTWRLKDITMRGTLTLPTATDHSRPSCWSLAAVLATVTGAPLCFPARTAVADSSPREYQVDAIGRICPVTSGIRPVVSDWYVRFSVGFLNAITQCLGFWRGTCTNNL